MEKSWNLILPGKVMEKSWNFIKNAKSHGILKIHEFPKKI